jgi:hypothetical protein
MGEMLKYLHAQAAGHKIYRSLAPGTISHWIDQSGHVWKWSEAVLEKVKAEGQRCRTGARLGCP